MDRNSIRRTAFLLWLLAVYLLAGCGAKADDELRLTVFAASSLTDAFEELGRDFESRNPGVEVRFNFAGSSTLLAQLRQGAPGDVFASADEVKMKVAGKEGLVGEPRVFAGNLPVIAVPKGNPAAVESPGDLAEPDLDLVLAQDGVPIAGYAKEILRNADARYGDGFEDRVMENVVSREADVRAAANKVALGEADATFVYASDVTPDVWESLDVVEIPEELNVVATYPIAAVEDTPNGKLAQKWMEMVLDEEGQRTMQEWGFRRAKQ